MAVEIERKFLVTGDAWREAARESRRMRQGYLAVNDECTVRVRLDGDCARLNIKSSGLDIERQEYEYEIDPGDAAEMLDTLCARRIVDKTRYFVEFRGHTFEVDEFHGDNAGLVVAEVELAARDEVFARPPWLGEEVSGDPRYLNSNLAGDPYRQWPGVT